MSTSKGDPVRGAPFLVVDIGGGSTEFVLGERDGSVRSKLSVDIGCVRLTERHLSVAIAGDPPVTDAIAQTRADIEAALDEVCATVRIGEAATLIGLAGSVTTVGAIFLGLPAYDPARIHGTWVPSAEVARISDALLAMTHDQRAALPVMHPGRIDVIGAGALILRAIVDRTGLPGVVVSEHDILDGICWALGAAD